MPEKTYKKSPAEGGSLLAKGKESLLTKSGFVQFTLNQYKGWTWVLFSIDHYTISLSMNIEMP